MLRGGGTERVRVGITDVRRTRGELARHRDRLGELVAERTHELTHELEERARAEATLRESEERFRQVAQSAQEAIVSVDSRARITFWNASAQRIFGHDFEEALGKPFFRLAPERHRAEQIARFDKVISGDPADLIGNTVEATGLRKDGGEFPMEVSFSQWTLGGESFYTAIMRAVTERKHAPRPTLVQSGATLGANCTVVCGITIGAYALVGAGSVVTKDVPAYGMVYGVPSRLTGWVSEEGIVLRADGDDFVCPETDKRYRLTEEVLAPV